MVGTGGNPNDPSGVLILTDAVEEPGTRAASSKGAARAPSKSVFARLAGLRSGSNATGSTTGASKAGATGASARKKRASTPYIDDQKCLRIGRRRFGVGLQWVPLDDGISVGDAIRLNAIAGESPNLYIKRRKAQQLGLAFTSMGLAHGYGVAATGFGFGKDEDWIAAFALEEITPERGKTPVWWLVGYRENSVYEDRLIFEPVAAKAAIEEHVNSTSWARVIAPADWAIPDADPSALEDWFLPRRAVGLVSTNPLRAYAVPGAAVVLLMVAAAGGYLYWQDLQEQERLRLEAEARQRERDRIAALQTPPWVGTPTVNEFLQVCTEAVERNLMFVPGWSPRELVCAHNEGQMSITTGWSRSGGRAAWLIAAASDQGLKVDLSPTLDGASFSEPVGFTERADVDMRPLDPRMLDETLRLRFDTLVLDAGLRTVAARPAPESAQQQGAPIWNYHALTFRTSAGLDEYLAVIADMPAIVPERLTYNPMNHEWVLDIRIYHPPIGGL